jgi:hypothetical protein
MLINRLPSNINKIALRQAIAHKKRSYVLMATQHLDPSTRALLIRALEEI